MTSSVARMSFNTITAKDLSLREVVDLCQKNSVGYIAPWRDLIAREGLSESAKIIKESGLGLSSLCRGGMFTAESASDRALAIEDNFRAIDEAFEIGAPVLVLVCGPQIGKDLFGSQEMVREGIIAIVDYADECGIDIAIEPLHPMMAASRSCITTIRQALDVAYSIDHKRVKIIVDAYHVWSDPHLYESTDSIKGRVAGFHISDWTIPITNELGSRAMPGEGCIDLDSLKTWVESAGFEGAIEVEVLSDYWWAQNPQKTFLKAVDSFRKLNWES
jgi:sugar phosphate isomerase/epimerase